MQFLKYDFTSIYLSALLVYPFTIKRVHFTIKRVHLK
nr:MAG TPA: hypothetical protein [Caudoviricetes sp.]